MNAISILTRTAPPLRNYFNRSTITVLRRNIYTLRGPLSFNNSFKNHTRFVFSINHQQQQQKRTAMSANEPCEACKTQPPVTTSGYKEKGSYETIAEHKCYVVQPSPQPKTGVLVVYDIFGYFPQTLQGADQIALTIPGHVLVMPDFFHGEPMDIKNYPPDTDEKKQKLGAFFSGPAQPPKTIEATKKIMAELKQNYPSVGNWGVLGLCWGGKVATLLSQTGDFAASAQVHPAMLDAKDAEKLNIPHLMLASKDEDKEVVKQYCEILAGKNNKSRGDTYPNDIHGWMGARGNLENDQESKSFEKGYADVIKFFSETL